MKENKNTFKLCGIMSYVVAALWTVSAVLNFFYNNKIALGAVKLCAAMAFVYCGMICFSGYQKAKQDSEQLEPDNQATVSQELENQSSEVQSQEQQTAQEQNIENQDSEN